MKNQGLMQLTVEVGKCIIPQLPHLEYSLTVRINKEIAASTTFRPPEGDHLDFATKLFLRMEKALLDSTPNCFISVTAITQKASRMEVARGEAKTSQEGPQSIRMKVLERQDVQLVATLEFCTSLWEVKQAKSNNNRLSNFKSHLSQKQSSSEQKQPQPTRTSPNFSHRQQLDKKQKYNESSSNFSSIKASRSEKVLPDNSVELETSANITKQSAHTDDHSASAHSLALQIKIDRLQQAILSLSHQLAASAAELQTANFTLEQYKARGQQSIHLLDEEKVKMLQCSRLLQQEKERSFSLSHLLELEKGRAAELEEAKEQLGEMLILQEQKNNISARHVQRLTKLIENLGNSESYTFNLIEEKDEIIMLNEQLQDELTNKNIAINQMKLQIEQLKQRISVLESSKVKAPVPEPPLEKHPPSAKQVDHEKSRLQKKTSEKNIQLPRKTEQQPSKPRELRKPKEKEVDKKDSKNDPSNNKKPVIPKNPRELKSSASLKAEVPAATFRTPKSKAAKPPLKIQQKSTIQTDKRSQVQSSVVSITQLETVDDPNNLMIHSRTDSMQLSKLRLS